MKRFFLLLFLLWSTLIFTFSSFPAEVSTSQSNIFIEPLRVILPTADNLTLTIIVRKSAHFFEYLVFGFLLFINIKNYFYQPEREDLNKDSEEDSKKYSEKYLKEDFKKLLRLVLPTILISLAFATLDELHQLFVPGRSCQALDITIDTAGAITGIILFLILVKIRNICYNRRHGRN